MAAMRCTHLPCVQTSVKRANDSALELYLGSCQACAPAAFSSGSGRVGRAGRGSGQVGSDPWRAQASRVGSQRKQIVDATQDFRHRRQPNCALAIIQPRHARMGLGGSAASSLTRNSASSARNLPSATSADAAAARVGSGRVEPAKRQGRSGRVAPGSTRVDPPTRHSGAQAW